MKEIGYEKAFAQYSKGIQFNQGIGLYDTVENNEKFFIGDQWHGIDTGGNPARHGECRENPALATCALRVVTP